MYIVHIYPLLLSLLLYAFSTPVPLHLHYFHCSLSPVNAAQELLGGETITQHAQLTGPHQKNLDSPSPGGGNRLGPLTHPCWNVDQLDFVQRTPAAVSS